jgi:hypothetical protein
MMFIRTLGRGLACIIGLILSVGFFCALLYLFSGILNLILALATVIAEMWPLWLMLGVILAAIAHLNKPRR